MTIDHMLNTIFHAAVWRSMHFAPWWLALGIAGVVAIVALRRR